MIDLQEHWESYLTTRYNYSVLQILKIQPRSSMTCALRPFGQPIEYGVNARHYIERIGISYLNVANLKPKQRKLILQEKNEKEEKKHSHLKIVRIHFTTFS